MLGFYDKLQKIKDTYFGQIIQEARNYKNIVIYGAGRVAKPLVHKLKEEHIKIKCFAVTDITINEKNFLGIPVRQIEDVKLDVEDTLIIIAVKYIWSADVQSKVEENGFIHFNCPVFVKIIDER